MATRIGQELVEFSFEQAQSRLDDGTLGFDPKSIDRFVKTFEVYEREFKRVFGSLVTTVSQIDQATGQAVRKIYLPKSYAQEASGVRNAVETQIYGSTGSDESRKLMSQTTADAHFLETTREIKGTKAQQFAKESVIEAGGKVIRTPGTSNKDMMTTFIPVSDAQLSSMSKKDIATFVRDTTPESNSASRAEAVKRNKEEHEAELERNAKRQHDHLRDLKRQNNKRQLDQERQQKQELKEAEKEEKEKIQSRKQLVGKVGKIATAIGALIDITRRILTSVMSFGSEFSKTTTKASTLNIGAQDVRNLTYLDKALGLDAGTQIQGQEDLRAKFGNTAKLDTEALKWLAMVMGDKVGQMVQSGLGGENPAYLMEQILDDFYKRQQEGKDQYGNYVGQDKARRSLVTLLESVSPAIARTFERMVEEQTSGLHAGEITSYRQLQSFYTPSTMGLESLDWDVLKTFGDEVNELKTKFYNLGEIIKTDVANALSGFVGKLNNLHIGQTEEEAFLEDLSDRDVLAGWRQTYESGRERTKGVLEDYFSDYGLGEMSIEEVIKYGGYQVDGTEGAERERILNARKALTSLFADPEKYNTLLTYYATGDLITDISKEEGKNNPNADPNKYGDTTGLALAKEAVEGKYLSLLGYLNTGGIEFTQELFTKDIGNGDLKFGDVVASKQQYFSRGADEFYRVLNASSSGSTYNTALANIIKHYNDTFGTSFSEKYIKNLSKGLMAGTINDNEKRILYDLFTYGTMSADVTSQARTLTQSLAKYMPDEYGLTTSEWSNINNTISNMKPSKYADKASYTEVKQGNTYGTIDITMHIMDSKGKEIEEVKKTIQGTLDKDFNYEEAIRNMND